MDFTGQFHHPFPAAGPAYQAFVPVDSAAAQDYGAATAAAPHATFDPAAAEHYHAYDFAPGYADHAPTHHQHHHHQPYTHAHPHHAPHAQQQQHHDDPAFPASETSPPPVAAAAVFAHPQPPPPPSTQPSTANARIPGHLDAALVLDDAAPPPKGSDDDDPIIPAQSRRKAQNRAAQRAFRERKEKHVKDLEAKLATLEAAQQKSSDENDRLKRHLEKMATENDILRATSSALAHRRNSSLSPEPAAAGPVQDTPQDFYSTLLQDHAAAAASRGTPAHRVVSPDSGERLLSVGAAWDLIISHDLYKRGLVDVGDVSERLRASARRQGQEPVFPEDTVLHAIEHSVASGSDDLL